MWRYEEREKLPYWSLAYSGQTFLLKRETMERAKKWAKDFCGCKVIRVRYMCPTIGVWFGFYIVVFPLSTALDDAMIF